MGGARHPVAACRGGLSADARHRARSIEVLGAKREEIGADGWWTIPVGRVKNKTEHRVWINEQARRALAAIEPYNRNSVYLFPSRDGGHLREFRKPTGGCARRATWPISQSMICVEPPRPAWRQLGSAA
jgi:integrase